MNSEVLNCFYRSTGMSYEFNKQKFICVLRELVIVRNTHEILFNGFDYYDEENDRNVKIVCDDVRYIEYHNFYEAMKMGITKFPFTIMPSPDTFLSINNIEEFEELYKKILDFRIDNKKRCWAIQYGFSYKDDEYEQLENLTERELMNWKDPRKNAKYTLDDITMDMMKAYGYDI